MQQVEPTRICSLCMTGKSQQPCLKSLHVNPQKWQHFIYVQIHWIHGSGDSLHPPWLLCLKRRSGLVSGSIAVSRSIYLSGKLFSMCKQDLTSFVCKSLQLQLNQEHCQIITMVRVSSNRHCIDETLLNLLGSSLYSFLSNNPYLTYQS